MASICCNVGRKIYECLISFLIKIPVPPRSRSSVGANSVQLDQHWMIEILPLDRWWLFCDCFITSRNLNDFSCTQKKNILNKFRSKGHFKEVKIMFMTKLKRIYNRNTFANIQFMIFYIALSYLKLLNIKWMGFILLALNGYKLVLLLYETTIDRGVWKWRAEDWRRRKFQENEANSKCDRS